MDTQLTQPVALPHVERTYGAAMRSDWRALRIVLAIGDCACIAASFYLAYVLRFWTGSELFHEAGIRPAFYAALTEVLMPCWVGIFALYGMYDLRNLLGGTKEYALAFNGCLLGMLLVMVVSFLVPDFVIARAWLIIAWLSAVTFTVGWRFVARRTVYVLRHHGRLSERIVVLGANSEGRAVAEQLSAWAACGAEIVGFIDDELVLGEQVLPHMPVLGPPTAFQAIVEQYRVDAVIIADTAMVRDRLPLILGAMDVLQRLDVRLAPGLFELLTTGVRVREQGGVPLLSLNKTRITGLHAFGKLLIDRVGALVGLLALSPVLALIALLIKLDDGGPIFHRRHVMGVGKRPFGALKFRTMIRDASGYLTEHPELAAELVRSGKLQDDPRVTHVGRALRRWSLDELPQLANVLLGQMSLVGPRMLTEAELHHFGRWQHNLLTVRPGLTGLWQVSGRSTLGYDERVRLDMHYIRNYSIWLDLAIIARTLPILVNGGGRILPARQQCYTGRSICSTFGEQP